MNITKQEANVLLTTHELATAQALRIMLKHEGIEFETAVGPDAAVTILKNADYPKFKKIAKEWNSAISDVYASVTWAEIPPILTLDQQMDQLRQKWPQAEIQESSTCKGTFPVTVPKVPLPQGYNRGFTTVYFMVPAGYPFAKPDRFYTDNRVRLESGGIPMLCRSDPCDLLYIFPALKDYMRWGWVVQSWDPRRDTLKTYMSVINTRLAKVK